MGENRGSSIVFRLIDRRNSQGAMGESAGRLFLQLLRFIIRARSEKILGPLGLAPDAYLERAKARILPLHPAFIRRETRYMSVLLLRP